MKLSSILIVDDSENDRYLLNRFIKKADLTDKTIEACDGEQALEILSAIESQPDLIFLDVNMPKVGGFEFLEKYNALQTDTSSLVVVMFTSSELDEEKRRAAQYSFVHGFMVKMPESAEALRVQVEAYMDKARAKAV